MSFAMIFPEVAKTAIEAGKPCTIYVHNDVQRQLGERALTRMNKDGVDIKLVIDTTKEKCSIEND